MTKEQNKKSSKIGQDWKSLRSNFACLFTVIAEVQFLEGRLGTQILNLKSLDNSWGNSFSKFFILDIKCRFTCGIVDLHWIIKKFQNFMTGFLEKLQYSQFNGGVYIFVVFDNK